jgi:CelD/BcsL family acetyltransferase involved in cellulose biosynthesis
LPENDFVMINCPDRCETPAWLDESGHWRIQLHTGDEALALLRPEWDRLIASSDADQFFALNAWQQLWWAHFGHEYALRVLTVRSETGKLVAIAPLMVSRFNPCAIVSLVGGTEISDFLDLIVDRDNAEALTTVLVSAIREHLSWKRLDLHGLQEYSRTPACLESEYARHEIKVEVQLEDVSPSVELKGSWDAYLASLSKKDRHELRRKLRRAVTDQAADWRTVSTEAELDANFNAFIRLHRSSSAEKAAFMTTQMEGYFRDLCYLALKHGWLRMGVLWVADVPVSTALGFAYYDKLYLYNSGYNPEYAAHSVGIAAVGLLMRDCAEEGIRSFDFLQGNEPYKYTLGAKDHPVYRAVCSRDQRP